MTPGAWVGTLGLVALLVAPWLIPGVIAGEALAMNGVTLIFAAGWLYIMGGAQNPPKNQAEASPSSSKSVQAVRDRGAGEHGRRGS